MAQPSSENAFSTEHSPCSARVREAFAYSGGHMPPILPPERESSSACGGPRMFRPGGGLRLGRGAPARCVTICGVAVREASARSGGFRAFGRRYLMDSSSQGVEFRQKRWSRRSSRWTPKTWQSPSGRVPRRTSPTGILNPVARSGGVRTFGRSVRQNSSSRTRELLPSGGGLLG